MLYMAYIVTPFLTETERVTTPTNHPMLDEFHFVWLSMYVSSASERPTGCCVTKHLVLYSRDPRCVSFEEQS